MDDVEAINFCLSAVDKNEQVKIAEYVALVEELKTEQFKEIKK